MKRRPRATPPLLIEPLEPRQLMSALSFGGWNLSLPNAPRPVFPKPGIIVPRQSAWNVVPLFSQMGPEIRVGSFGGTAGSSTTGAGMLTTPTYVLGNNAWSGSLTVSNSATLTAHSLSNGGTSSSASLFLQDSADLGLTAFRGRTVTTSPLVWTTGSTATIDGKVDASDLNLLATRGQNLNLSTATASTATVSASAFDLNALAANWQLGTTS